MLITADDFDAEAVFESFEGILPSADAVYLGFGAIDLGSATGSYQFSSGVSAVAISSDPFDLDPFVGDFALGEATYFLPPYGDILTAGDVLFGTAYLANIGFASTLTIEFDGTVTQAGAYLLADDTVTVAAYDINGILLSVTAVAPVPLADWGSNFIGFGEIGEIHSLVFTGHYIVLDGLMFTPSESGGANLPPLVAHPIADLDLLEDEAFSFTVPADAFNDPDGDGLTYSASLAGGGSLPSWLAFDAGARTFSGLPQDGDAGVSVVVTATDPAGLAVSDSFDVILHDNPGETWTGTVKADVHTGTVRQDVLMGGDGHDHIDGGAAADRITGGKGNDVMTGGTGRDAFLFDLKSGQDDITDFELGIDRFELTAGVNVKSIKLFDADGDGSLESTRVQFSDGGSVTLLGVVGVTSAADLLTPDWMA